MLCTRARDESSPDFVHQLRQFVAARRRRPLCPRLPRTSLPPVFGPTTSVDIVTRGLSGYPRQRHRLICSVRKSEHITPILMDLHWLRTQERIQYKLCVLVFKCKHSLAPAYLSEQLKQVAQLETWSHDSASDLPACQRSSWQRPEFRRLVTDLSLPPAPGPGIVCRPLSPHRI